MSCSGEYCMSGSTRVDLIHGLNDSILRLSICYILSDSTQDAVFSYVHTPNFIFLAFEHDIYCNIPVSLNVYCVSYLLLVYTYFLTHLTCHAYQVPHNTRVKCSYDWEKLMCNFWCNESFLPCEVGETLWYKNFTH